jgi:hypothetical protein
MAQTKTRSKPKPKARGSSGKPKKARSASKPKASASSKPKTNGTSKPKAAVDAVEDTAKDAGRAVGNAAGKAGQAVSKAKVPLMAGGAALAGVAGGIALGNRQAHRHRGLNGLKVKGIDSDDLAKAAKKVGKVSMQIGELAVDARRAREQSNGSSHRSPIEVVLQGLTSRQSREH